jgi:hypothetical protein
LEADLGWIFGLAYPVAEAVGAAGGECAVVSLHWVWITLSPCQVGKGAPLHYQGRWTQKIYGLAQAKLKLLTQWSLVLLW